MWILLENPHAHVCRGAFVDYKRNVCKIKDSDFEWAIRFQTMNGFSCFGLSCQKCTERHRHSQWAYMQWFPYPNLTDVCAILFDCIAYSCHFRNQFDFLLVGMLFYRRWINQTKSNAKCRMHRRSLNATCYLLFIMNFWF